MRSITKFSTNDQDIVRAMIRPIIQLSREREKSSNYYKSRAERLAFNEIDLKSKLETANAELNARPYIELLQRKAMPAWLLNDEDLTAESKWTTAFRFRLTRCARILVYRMDTMEPNVGHTTAATILDNSYDVFSEIFEHKKKVRPLRLSDEGWLSFFGKVGIDDPFEQEAFKSLVKPITVDEYNQNPIIKPFIKNRYMFLVKYLDIEPKDGESEATRHIEKICGKPLVDTYYPKNRSGNYSNMVVFLLESCTSKDAYDISEQLKSNPRKACTVSVKYDIYNPNL